MAFDLAFTTQDYDEGQAILIVDSSTDWATVPTCDQVVFTISSMYSGVVIGTTPDFNVEITVDIGTGTGEINFIEGFQFPIYYSDIFSATADDVIPNSIYTIKMDLYNLGSQVAGSGNTFTSNEVYYYDAMYIRDAFISELASYDTDITNKQMEYANWLDFLITSIESNTSFGNSSAIYYIFDTFTSISE